jgi:hypothetical protein
MMATIMTCSLPRGRQRAGAARRHDVITGRGPRSGASTRVHPGAAHVAVPPAEVDALLDHQAVQLADRCALVHHGLHLGKGRRVEFCHVGGHVGHRG